MTVDDVIKQVCNELGVLVGEITPIGVNVDFIADAMTGTEIIKKAFDLAYAANQRLYHCYMKEDKLYVVEENEIVEKFKNLINTLSQTDKKELIAQVKKAKIDNPLKPKDANEFSVLNNLVAEFEEKLK